MNTPIRPSSTGVFFAWLLTSSLLASFGGALIAFGTSTPSNGRVALAVALGLCQLAVSMRLWRSIRPVRSAAAASHPRFDSQERLQALIDSMPALVARFDGAQRCLFVNRRALEIMGLTHGQAVGKCLRDVLPAEDYAMYVQHIPIVMAGQRTAFEGAGLRDGKAVHYIVTLIPERDMLGEVIGFFLMTSDITAVKLAQSEVLRSETRLRAITDNLPVMICAIDTQGRLQFANRNFEQRTGIAAPSATGRPLRDLIGEPFYKQAESAIESALGGTRSLFEAATDSDGTRCYWQGLCVPDIDSQGVVTCLYALLTDITALRKAELNMAELALTDALTGLPNRRRLDAQLPAALARARRLTAGFALLFLDIDHFKQINDQHGHAVGDAVLAAFAARLSAAVRSTDFVARYAGDEFVVILEGVATRQSGEQVAADIVRKVREPLQIDQLVLTVTTSIGVAYLEPGGLAEVQVLLDAADQALYQTKTRGRDDFTTCAVSAGPGIIGFASIAASSQPH